MVGLLICIGERWHPAVGDNDPAGWAVVALYLLASGLALRAARRIGPEEYGAGRLRLFWWATAALLVLMAANKQFDGQTLMIATGHCLSDMQGWADWRAAVKRGTILLAGAVIGLGLVVALAMLQGVARRIWLPLAGLGFVGLYVVFLATWHGDIHIPVGTALGMRGQLWLVEFPGPALIAIGAAMFATRRPQPRTAT